MNCKLFERPVYFDGGMGTLLQSMGLKGGERPETWNVLYPERVVKAHASYLQAGSDIITSNSFGATRAHLGDQAEKCMRAAIRAAKQAVSQAGYGYVAADMGSLGQLLSPYGDMPFEEAVAQFREAFGWAIEECPDMLLIETMTDLLETKACVLGAKEALEMHGVELPLLVSMTFDARGRLLTGADIAGTAAMLMGLRADAIGINCGDAPGTLMPNFQELTRVSSLPTFFSPNASLPIEENGETIFPTDPAAFARQMLKAAELGAWGLGGCCGTTPAHIRELVSVCKKREVRSGTSHTCVISGRAQSVTLGQRPIVIGERLNPTGKPQMKQALRQNDLSYPLRVAVAQCDAGANVLDINAGMPEIDETHMLREMTVAVQRVCDVPLQLDTADPCALEAALRVYVGRPLINSVSGKQKSMDEVFPLAAKYGGAIVALTLDENGIPETAEGRLIIARRIIDEAEKYGIPREDLLFDALTMTVATNPQAAKITLETVARLKSDLGVKTVLGVSNVSFGLPQRGLLTAAFIAEAIAAGLDAAIMNPNDHLVRASFDAAVALCGKDAGFDDYLARYGGDEGQLITSVEPKAALPASPSAQPDGTPVSRLKAAIEKGLAHDATAEAERLLEKGTKPLDLIDNDIMPALSAVGEGYEKGKLFLPQLLQSAAAAQAAFEMIRMRIPASPADEDRKFVLATVHGDVHDIGKNIVKVLLQNYGFAVTDLGRDVPPQSVLDAVEATGAKLVGLSALMTTTVPAMRETIRLLRERAPQVKIIVGGAVLTEAYAESLGADGYGRDAMAAVRWALENSAQQSREE